MGRPGTRLASGRRPRAFRALSLCAATLAAGALGCGDDGDGAGGSVAEATVELGTGCFGEFTPLSPGDPVILEAGNQGLRHIWVTARAPGLPDGPRTSTTFQLRFAEEPPDGESDLLSARTTGFSYERFDDAAGGDPVLSGIRIIVAEWRAALDADLELQVTLEAEGPDGALEVIDQDLRPVIAVDGIADCEG